MWKPKRRQYVIQKRKKIFLRLFFLLLFIIISSVGSLYFMSQQVTIVSPVPVSLGGQHVLGNAVVQKELEEELKKAHIFYMDIQVAEDNSYIVTLQNKEVVIFSSVKSYKQQVASLQLVLSRLTIEGKHIERLDLRFEKPIVVFRE